LCQVLLEDPFSRVFILPIPIALPSVLHKVVIYHQPVITLPSLSPGTASQVVAPQKASHTGLLEPRGSSTVRKAPGVRDKTSWSVKP
jgi:hypothetical protein